MNTQLEKTMVSDDTIDNGTSFNKLLKNSNQQQPHHTAPDWLKAHMTHYYDEKVITSIHNHTYLSHLIVCGLRSDILSNKKEVRNKCKIPLTTPELPYNVYKWSEVNHMEKNSINHLLSYVRKGHILAYIPSSFNLIILDVDNGDYKQLIKESGEPLVILSTPSGGKHLVYNKPQGQPPINKKKLQDYCNAVEGDIIDNAGYVLLYSPKEFVDALNNNNFKPIDQNFMNKMYGVPMQTILNNKVSKNSWNKPTAPQKANYNINDGPITFRNATEGTRNDTGNKMMFRDAFYGVLDDQQHQRYVDASKKNGLGLGETMSILTHALEDGKKSREKHKDKFGVYPLHIKQNNSSPNLAFDNLNPLEIQRVIKEVIGYAEHSIRGDIYRWKAKETDPWQLWTDCGPLQVHKEIATQEYYTPGKNRDIIANMSLEQIRNEMNLRFKENEVDVIKNYINSLDGIWDGADRISGLFHQLFKCNLSQSLTEKTTMFLLGTLSRILKPGCKHDFLYYFQGPQNIGKTMFFKYFFPDEFNNHVVSGNLNLRDNQQKLLESIGNAVFGVFDESVGYKKAEAESLKSLCSTQKFVYRKPYDRTPTTIKTSFVLCATTNHDDFLISDTSGARRWIVFELDPNRELGYHNGWDIEAYMNENRNQLWAQVLHLYNEKKFKPIFTTETHKQIQQENKKYRNRDLRFDSIVSQSINEGVLKHKTRWYVMLWEAGLLNVRNGISNELSGNDIRRSLIAGNKPSDINLVQSGSKWDRDALKQSLKHFGYEIKKGRPVDGNSNSCTICYNINTGDKQ